MVDTDELPSACPPPTPALPRARSRRRASATAASVAAIALLGLAGCGGDGDDEEATDGGAELTAADARAADRSVKEGAVEIMESVESCFRGSGDYGACRQRTEIGATKLAVVPDSPGVGEATISRGTTTGYRILAVSLSGSRFAITRQIPRVIRSCAARTPLGKSGGGCEGNGW